MFNRFNTALVAAFLVVVAPAFGKDVTKQARSNDVASQYTLDDRGNFFRQVGRNKCQITNDVEDFKVSQHPNDVAMVYFIKKRDLYVLHNTVRTGNCPKASTKVLQNNIAKKHGDYRYSVVSNTDTTIVNVALGENGRFTAWDDTKLVLDQSRVADYTMHGKFGVKGAPFSSYALFLINETGNVLKVKGNNPAGSLWDTSERFLDLAEFKAKYKIQ